MRQVFERIYAQNAWGNAESRSGDGSDAKGTEAIRAVLPALFREFAIKSILDLPCGDFNWMRLLDIDLDYIGADIVTEVIEQNRRMYERPGHRFEILDITKDPVPTVDLIFCRDILVHLSFREIEEALANITLSGSRYLLTTTFPSRDVNRDVEAGQWRPLNLQRPPFSFPPPVRLIVEHCAEWDGQWADKSLGLWQVADIAGPAHRIVERSRSIGERAPRVSVVIPTYNRENYIGQAVASALGQSYRDLEVIVVDDGSIDSTENVLKSFSDPRLVCFRQENAGRSRARNVAISAARGEYITFLDSDDYYLPSKVELQVAFLDANPAYGMVYTSAACVDDDGCTLNYIYHASLSGRIYPSIAFFIPHTITLPTVMIRREILSVVGPFDEAMARFEDTDMWRRISKHTPIAGIDQVTCHIRTHAGNRLEGLDPAMISRSIDYYVAKIIADDVDIDPVVLNAGARRLFEYYGNAMLTLPEFTMVGKTLLKRGREHFEPLVSIVMPVYNGANYLGDAIDSALRQTYARFEIIVVNDGSDDNGATERVALSYGDRIRYVSQPNGGVASALNEAIRNARGEYVSWLSHDDLYTPDKLERQVDFLTLQPEPHRCIVYGDYTVFSETSGPEALVALPHVEPECFQYFITTQNILHGCTLIIPRSAFWRHGQFDEKLRTTQDYDLWFRMAKTEKFVHLAGTVVRSRYHAEQGTRRMLDVVMIEADRLLTNFVEDLTLEQVETGASCHPIRGYQEIAASLHARNFKGAAARAGELADTMFNLALGPLIGEASQASHGLADADAVHAIRVEVAAASELRLERFALEKELDLLHAEVGSLRA